MSDRTVGIVCALFVWIMYCLVWLSVSAGLLYVAYHFISKFW